jgi:transcriptional regulator with XRE-family HTH domain
MNLGTVVRDYRKKKNLTLKKVAAKAGISEGFLSQVENNVNSPSVETLVKICGAIGVNAGDILNRIEKQEKLVLLRRDDWKDVDIPHTGFATRRFFPPENRTVIDSAILVIEPGTSIPVRKNIKNGQELLCVLKGSLELVHGERVIELEKGDIVHFWSEPTKQKIMNKSSDRSTVLWVGTL